MKTLSFPEWKVIHHDSEYRDFVNTVTDVFTECRLDAQVIWDRDGPSVTFKNDKDAEVFLSKLNHKE